MFKKIIDMNIQLVTLKPKLVLTIGLIITIIALLLASTLEMDLNWVALAPKGHPTVEEYISITDNFSTMDNIIVVVESENKEELVNTINLIEEEIMKLEDYVTTVNPGIDTEFMINKGLLYYPPEELELIGYMLTDLNLDTFYTMLVANIEASMISLESDTLTKDEIAYQATSMEAMLKIIKVTNQGLKEELSKEELDENIQKAMTQFFVGDGLITSLDRQMAIVTILPSFDMMDMEKLVPGVNTIEATLKTISDSNEAVSVKATGMHIVARDEMNSVSSDSQFTTILSFILILFILYFAFRSFFAPVLSFIPLIFGIIWSMGITALTIGRLNMITIFCSAMLLGLGIDYAIHMYSSYSEKRAKGYNKIEAIHQAIGVAGPGIIIGALTTAIAFFALNISSLEILSELGTVMGTGIITSLLAVFWMLPALIMIKKENEVKIMKITGEFKFIGRIATQVQRFKWITLIILILLTGFMATKIQDIRFDTNLMNLEPKNLESIELMNYLVEKYDMSADSFSVEVDNLEDVYKLHKAFESIDGVYQVTSVANVLPEEAKQEKSLEKIKDIRELLKIQSNVRTADLASMYYVLQTLEISVSEYEEKWNKNKYKGLDQDVFASLKVEIHELLNTIDSNSIQDAQAEMVSKEFYNIYRELGNRMLTDELITTNNLPEAFKRQFISKDESKYLITVIPEFDIWSNLDTPKGELFISNLVEVDKSITGTPFFMKVLYDAAGKEVAVTGYILFGLLVSILFIHFKSVKYTLLAFLPLLFTIIFMIGTMVIINLPFNMLNFLSILLVIGIGLDDGVHILHHYKVGERHIGNLFSSVGRAIMLTTVTTVFGFGSMAFSSYRGIATLGVALAIGVSYAFIMTIVILPIFLKNENKNI